MAENQFQFHSILFSSEDVFAWLSVVKTEIGVSCEY